MGDLVKKKRNYKQALGEDTCKYWRAYGQWWRSNHRALCEAVHGTAHKEYEKSYTNYYLYKPVAQSSLYSLFPVHWLSRTTPRNCSSVPRKVAMWHFVAPFPPFRLHLSGSSSRISPKWILPTAQAYAVPSSLVVSWLREERVRRAKSCASDSHHLLK